MHQYRKFLCGVFFFNRTNFKLHYDPVTSVDSSRTALQQKHNFKRRNFFRCLTFMQRSLKNRSRRTVPRCKITINTCQVSRAIFPQHNKTLSFSPTSSHPSVLHSSLLFDTVMFHPQECTSRAAAKSSANTSIFLLSFNVQVELSSLCLMSLTYTI